MTDPEQGAAPRMPGVGEMAPDFTLPDDTGTPRSLRDQRGHGWCSGSTPRTIPPAAPPRPAASAMQMRNYRELGAEIWGVSKLGVGSKAAFKAKFGLPFTLLADEDHEVSRRYGTWVLKNNYGKVSEGIQRATFLLDPEGRVARAWPRVKPEGHADEVLAAIRELEGKPAAA